MGSTDQERLEYFVRHRELLGNHCSVRGVRSLATFVCWLALKYILLLLTHFRKTHTRAIVSTSLTRSSHKNGCHFSVSITSTRNRSYFQQTVTSDEKQNCWKDVKGLDNCYVMIRMRSGWHLSNCCDTDTNRPLWSHTILLQNMCIRKMEWGWMHLWWIM